MENKGDDEVVERWRKEEMDREAEKENHQWRYQPPAGVERIMLERPPLGNYFAAGAGGMADGMAGERRRVIEQGSQEYGAESTTISSDEASTVSPQPRPKKRARAPTTRTATATRRKRGEISALD